MRPGEPGCRYRMKKEAAFSGLEAAIVLIAFVVVGAVFAYIMLGAGFFATSKSQEIAYSGLKQTTSNVVLDGFIYGSYSANAGGLQSLTFYIKAPEGGDTLKLDQISYLIAKNSGISTPTTPVTGQNGLLSPGDRAKVIIRLLSVGPVAGSSFSVEIKPTVGCFYAYQAYTF